jgi:hypothetical protein
MSQSQRREAQHRRSASRIERVADLRDANPHSSADRYALMEQCAYEGVRLVFSHLSIDRIRQPPRQWMEAKLARQIAIRIMAVEMNMEQRQVTRMQQRQRTSIHFAIQAVDRRLEEPVFARAYRRMVERATALYCAKFAQLQDAA